MPAAQLARPATVTTASIIGIVLGSLVGLMALIVVLMGLFVGSVAGGAAQMAEAEDAGRFATMGTSIIILLGLLLAAIGAMFIAFSIKAMKRRNWARVTITVLLALGILSNLADLVTGGSNAGGVGSTLVGLAIGGTMLVLYWLPASSQWYAARNEPTTYPGGPPPQPGTHQPGGPGFG